MRENKLIIQIKKPVREVFAFLLNPSNSPLWIDSFVREETNEWPVKVGTIYRNQNREGKWAEYTVTAFKENKMFGMTSADKNYHVRYILRPINNNTTELEYYEWVEERELEEPFTVKILNKLKAVLEMT